MSRKQIAVFILIGVAITAGVGLFPLAADAVAKNYAPTGYLYNEKELIEYLQYAQKLNDTYIGIHGYNHVCPICGKTTHEMACDVGVISTEELDWRFSEGIDIFNKSGLIADFYAFPGEAYDNRCISLLCAKGFHTVEYRMGGEIRQMPVGDRMLNYSFPSVIAEYTWNWRYGVSEEVYNAALHNITVDKPVEILTHIEDFTNQTARFFDFAIKNLNTTVIRCDDITSDWDLPKTKALVEFCQSHNVDLLLAVIPTFKMRVSSVYSSTIESFTWYMFLASFLFPVAVTVPWAVWFKFKRKIKTPKYNPHYPTVSMILPAYNEEKIIETSIQQVLKQDYKGSIEVIVVDDGSTDKTRSIVQTYSEKHPNVKLICQPKNMGKPSALNTGFKCATGEICIFQDTDSVIASNLVSLMVPHFKNAKVGMVAGMIVVGNEGNMLTKMQQIEYLYSQTVIRFCQASHLNVLVCPGAATAVRTEIAKSIPSTDRTVTEDADFTFEVWKAGWKVSQEPEAISYTEAPENMSQFFDQRKRWLYGVLQTIVLHKWALKKNNIWVFWAWLGYIMCPLTIVAVVSPFMFGIFYGQTFLVYFVIYTLLTFSVFSITQTIGVLMYGKKKIKLLLLPVYALYQLMLQIMLVYLVFAYVTRRGIRVHYGGKIIHAVH